MNLTRKENLRRVLRGEPPAWVPFAINFEQWFTHHQKFGLLPPALRGCADYINAQKILGCDIFSRNLNGGFVERNPRLAPRVTTTETPLGQRSVTEYDTPQGTLRTVYQGQAALTTGHVEECLVKDWARDGAAFRIMLEQREYDWNEDVFQATRQRVGDDGIINVSCGCTPLKFLHWSFGLDHACLFIMDYPEVARELCDLYWAKLRPVLDRLAKHPDVESVILQDNVDTPFYPPSLAAVYWAPYVREATELMRRHGKHLFVHACGRLAGLSSLFAETRVSGLEGVTHPPLGDWTASAAQQCHPSFIFVGGFSAREQEQADDGAVREFYQDNLGRASKERFIFASSCQTSIFTNWERLLLVRDICRDWGGSPPPERSPMTE